jgi:Calcineurin-like phosphoesterase
LKARRRELKSDLFSPTLTLPLKARRRELKSDLFSPTLTLPLKAREYSGFHSARSLNKFCYALIVLTMLFICASETYAAETKPFSFALMGDVPYHDGEVIEVERMLGEISGENMSFVVHVGDFKNGSSPCTDELFLQRKQLFNQSMHPFIYVPGDNDWTDCHRPSAGSYKGGERLAKLRDLFFTGNQSLGRKKISLQQQSEDSKFGIYRENVRWSQDNVLFISLNIPGSSNNTGHTLEDNEEARLRNIANAAWIQQAFSLAKQQKYAGVMFFIQADPMFEFGSTHQGLRSYWDFLDVLRDETEKFSGQVVLAHGDTHFYRVDQPLRDFKKGGRVKNFTRVEVFGSPAMNWIRVHVDATSKDVFRFEPAR